MFSQIVNTERLTDPGLVDRLASALAHTSNLQTTSLRRPTTDLAFVGDTLTRVGAELNYFRSWTDILELGNTPVARRCLRPGPTSRGQLESGPTSFGTNYR